MSEEAAPAPVVEEKKCDLKSGKCNCPFAGLGKSKVAEKLSEIFHWKNIILSVLSFVIFNVLAYTIVKLEYTFLTLFIYFVLIATILCFSIGYGPVAYGEYIAKKKVENPIAPYAEKVKIPRDWIKETANLAGDFVNVLLETVFNIIFVKDVCMTIKGFFAFCFFAILANCYTFCGLVWFFADFFFIWCPLYDFKKDMIDDIFAKVEAALKELFEKVEKAVKDAINKPKAQ